MNRIERKRVEDRKFRNQLIAMMMIVLPVLGAFIWMVVDIVRSLGCIESLKCFGTCLLVLAYVVYSGYLYVSNS